MQSVLIDEKDYSKLFKIGLYLKGIGAISDIISGLLVWFLSKAFLVTFLLNLFHNELSDDPKDFVAKFIVDSAAALSVSSQHFLAAYLLVHGIIKFFLVINLFKRKLWAYPASIVIFTLLIIIELYELYYKYSIWLLVFIIIDILVVLLAIHEYGVLRKKIRRNKLL